MSRLLEKIQSKIHTHEVREEAPIVKERIHEHYEHVDKTSVQEAHERIQVEQVVQPIVDERHEHVKVRSEDHGLEVHEHGRAGLDAETEAELEARRRKVAATGGTKVDRVETRTTERPDIDVTSRTHTIEQVIPVAEIDIYKPERIEHHKREVEIYHDQAEILGTKVRAAISAEEWERKGGHISHSGTHETIGEKISDKVHRRGSRSSSSSSSSDDEKRRDGKSRTSRSGYGQESLGEKIGDKLSSNNTTTSSSTYNNTSGEYNTTTDKPTLTEKIGDKLGFGHKERAPTSDVPLN
jgi:hypothetical protein